MKLKNDPDFVGYLVGIDYSDDGTHSHALVSVAKPGSTGLRGNVWIALDKLEV